MDCPVVARVVAAVTFAALVTSCGDAQRMDSGMANAGDGGLAEESAGAASDAERSKSVGAGGDDGAASARDKGSDEKSKAGSDSAPKDNGEKAGPAKTEDADEADEPSEGAATEPKQDGVADENKTELEPWWHPPLHSTWDWQLAVPVDYGLDLDVYDVDMATNTAETIHAIRTNGGLYEDQPERQRKIICYINVGSWENYREDAAQFPESVRGALYHGFPDENWLDIRQIDILAPVIKARLELAKAKGCDAVEPDNMDGYNDTAHEPSGFPLTAEDQLRYNRWVSEQVHALGMAVGLKNDTAQAAELVDAFDFAVSEECVAYQECQFFEPFTKAGKPVFLAEYDLTVDQFCPEANQRKLMGIRKTGPLDSYREACPDWSGDKAMEGGGETDPALGGDVVSTAVIDRAFGFVKAKMRNADGGIYTNFVDGGFEDEVYVYGHHVTSEHMGLMLWVSAALGDRDAFAKSFAFVESRMVSARTDLVFWAIDKNTGMAYAEEPDASAPYYNSPLDDFRVVKGLITGYERFKEQRYLDLALRIGAGLYERSVVRGAQYGKYAAGLVTNGFNWSESTGEGQLQADLIPINYADLWTMRWLANHDSRWMAVIDSAASLMRSAQLSSGQYYNTYYADGRFAGDWEYQPGEVGEVTPPAEKVKTIQSLWIAIHLARIGDVESARKAFDFYHARYDADGRIAEYYNYDGTEPTEGYFADTLRRGEARIYAQLARLAYHLNEPVFAERVIRDHITSDQVTDMASPVYGYIGMSSTEAGDADAWNVLESLLALLAQQKSVAVTHNFAP